MALFRWIRRILLRSGHDRAPRPSGRPRNWHRFLLHLEQLETRLAPANTINIVVGVAGSGQLDQYLSGSDGTILVSDDPGATETLSTGALSAVGPSVNISITAANAIVFTDIGTLNLLTGPGTSVAFTANTGAISFANTLNLIETGGAALSF